MFHAIAVMNEVDLWRSCELPVSSAFYSGAPLFLSDSLSHALVSSWAPWICDCPKGQWTPPPSGAAGAQLTATVDPLL